MIVNWENLKSKKDAMTQSRIEYSRKLSTLTSQLKLKRKEVTQAWKAVSELQKDLSPLSEKIKNHDTLINEKIREYENAKKAMHNYRVSYILEVDCSKNGLNNDITYADLGKSRDNLLINITELTDQREILDKKFRFLEENKLAPAKKILLTANKSLKSVSDEIHNIKTLRLDLDRRISSEHVQHAVIDLQLTKIYDSISDDSESIRIRSDYVTAKHSTLVSKTQTFVVSLQDYLRVEKTNKYTNPEEPEMIITEFSWLKVKEGRDLTAVEGTKATMLENSYNKFKSLNKL